MLGWRNISLAQRDELNTPRERGNRPGASRRNRPSRALGSYPAGSASSREAGSFEILGPGSCWFGIPQKEAPTRGPGGALLPPGLREYDQPPFRSNWSAHASGRRGHRLAGQLRAEECERLLAVLGDAELRRVALLRMDGHSVEEVAERVGCAPRSVKRKLQLIRGMWEREARQGAACRRHGILHRHLRRPARRSGAAAGRGVQRLRGRVARTGSRPEVLGPRCGYCPESVGLLRCKRVGPARRVLPLQGGRGADRGRLRDALRRTRPRLAGARGGTGRRGCRSEHLRGPRPGPG